MKSPLGIRTMLLELLQEGPKYGNELAAEIEQRTHRHVKAHKGSLYPALQRLEEDGMVELVEDDPSELETPNRRRVYRLTNLGRSQNIQDRAIVQHFFGWV